MDIDLIVSTSHQMARHKTDALVILVTQDMAKAGASRGSAQGEEQALDPLQTLIATALKLDALSTQPGKTLATYQPSEYACRHLILVGAGEASPAEIRKAVAAGLRVLPMETIKNVVIGLSFLPIDKTGLLACLSALSDASYCYTHTKPSAKARKLENVTLACAHPVIEPSELPQLRAYLAGIETAKEWGNRPPNHATPTHLGDAALEIAQACPSMQCEVMGPKEISALKMGAFQAVAQGSQEAARLIVLHYQGAEKNQAPLALVGKGITFDAGGISLKPSADMDEMKFDMCGAASVLGVFAALAQWQPALNVVGIIPACENLPDGKALKPGDVVKSMSGQTIEILNTDAEGRLILCDALHFVKRYKPQAVVDIATLTGACVIALGSVRSGMFSNDDSLAVRLTLAGEQSLDPCWRMPLDDAYAEGLSSHFADMANIAGRQAGAITAAKFLQRFTKDLCWAHLDIAGVAWRSGKNKGATGRPVPLLLEWINSYLPEHAIEATPPGRHG